MEKGSGIAITKEKEMRLIIIALCWLVGFSTATLGGEPLKILGVNFDMKIMAIQRELRENRNMECFTKWYPNGAEWQCYSDSTGARVSSGNKFHTKEYVGIMFNCEAFNGCSYQIGELANAISEKFDLNMQYTSWTSNWFYTDCLCYKDYAAYASKDGFGNRIFVIDRGGEPAIYLTDSPKLNF